MTQLSDIIQVTINISTLRPVFPGFGIPLIADQFASFASDSSTVRYRKYSGIDDTVFLADWPTTSKVYKAVSRMLEQVRNVSYFYVGRKDAGDADWTASLNAINTVLNDYYAIITTERTKANILLIAAWAESHKKIYGVSSEEAAVITSVTTDIESALKAANYNKTFHAWHYRGGIDFTTGASAAVISGTAPDFVVTVTETAHGLRVDDDIVASGAATKTQINGEFSVDTVPDANTFTYKVTSNTLTTGTEAAAMTFAARYEFLEAAIIGDHLPTTPGQYSWNFANLVGVTPSPLDFLSETQEGYVLGKNGNVYTALGKVSGFRVGTMASGRFIDIEISKDWLEANIGQSIYNALINVPKIPYTDAGMVIIQNAIESVLRQAVANGILGPLLPPDSFTGELYKIVIPKVSEQTSSNRQNRIVSGIKVSGQMAGAVNKVAITVNASF